MLAMEAAPHPAKARLGGSLMLARGGGVGARLCPWGFGLALRASAGRELHLLWVNGERFDGSSQFSPKGRAHRTGGARGGRRGDPPAALALSLESGRSRCPSGLADQQPAMSGINNAGSLYQRSE